MIHSFSSVARHWKDLLSENEISVQGRSVIEDLQEALDALESRWMILSMGHKKTLKTLGDLDKKADLLNKNIDQLREKTLQTMETVLQDILKTDRQRKTQFQQQCTDSQATTREAFSTQLTQDKRAQQAVMEQEREEALVQQTTAMEAYFTHHGDAMATVERERQEERLQRVAGRLGAIREETEWNAEALSRSRHLHTLYTLWSALASAVAGDKKPFAQELEALCTTARKLDIGCEALESVPRDVADQGIDGVKDLSYRFEGVAKRIRHAALVPEEGGLGAHIVSRLLSTVMFTKKGLVQGEDVEAILSRTGYYLEKQDLENATRELNQLQGWPKRLAFDWIEAARRHLEVQQTLEVVRLHLYAGIVLNSE
ncbi:mitochondrial inner membrane protein Mitofilin [Spinellus fusiger]|nr:mitochondrial inner membrane protein Mitofilin [Spinellus fusiger]